MNISTTTHLTQAPPLPLDSPNSVPMPELLKIAHPRRILVIGPPKAGKLTFLRALTGSLPPLEPLQPPTNDTTSCAWTTRTNGVENYRAPHAGLSHSYRMTTSYYEAEIPIWVDEWEETTESLKIWAEQYLEQEAEEVIKALGGIIVCLREPLTKVEIGAVTTILSSVQNILNKHTYGFDGVCLAILMPRDGIQCSTLASSSISNRNAQEAVMSFDDWDNLSLEFGFEFINFSSTGRNEYSEPMGMERVIEALQSNDWSFDDDAASLLEYSEEEDGKEGVKGEGGKGLQSEVAELEQEMFGLSMQLKTMALEGQGNESGNMVDEDEEKQVEKFESIMLKMAALRELGDNETSKQELKRLAAQLLSIMVKEGDEIGGNTSKANEKNT